MCLRTYDINKKVASKNIACYKYGTFIGDSFHPEFRSFEYKKYRKNIAVELDCSIHPHVGFWEVDMGYHSFNYLNDCKALTPESKIALFVIPKGAEYIDGTWDGGCANRVSTTIICLGKNTKFNRLIAKIFYGVSFDK